MGSRRTVAVLGLLVGVGLSGCGGSTGDLQAGVAAEYGSESISVNSLQDRSKEMLAFATKAPNAGLPTDPGAMQRRVLTDQILLAMQEKLLEDNGVEVAEAEIGKVRSEIRKVASQQKLGLSPRAIDYFARSQVVFGKVPEALLGRPMKQSDGPRLGGLYQKKMAEIAKAWDITINPRYGQWKTATQYAPQGGQPVEAIDPQGGELVKTTRSKPSQQPQLPPGMTGQ